MTVSVKEIKLGMKILDRAFEKLSTKKAETPLS
jgi:hypothetical protein